MFGPAPSGPRFPYPYRLLSRLPPVRTSARFFSSVPVVSPWRSKSPFLPAFRSESLEIPFCPLPSSFSQGHEIPDVQAFGSSVLEPRSFPTTGRASGSPPFFPPRRGPSAPAGSVLWSLGVCGRACRSVPSQAFFLSSSPRNPVRALFRKALFSLCIRPQCVDRQYKLTSSPARMRSGSESEQRPLG